MNDIAKSSAEKLSILKRAATNSLLNFAQILNPKFEVVWFHEVIARKLEEALIKAVSGGKARIIITVPPRHGKSQLASTYFPAWALGKYPDIPFILSSYGAELSEKIGMQTRDVIASELYQAIFPDIQLRPDQKAKAKWMTNKGGSFTAVGIGGAVTGVGGKIILIDDPHKDRAEAESPLMRERVWEYYQSTLYSRLEGAGAIILIMQRWHQQDLVGKVLEEAERLKEAGQPYDEWEVINFPAIAEEDEYHDGNLIRKRGEPLWPNKFPLDVLKNIEAKSVYNWSCTPAETPILMADWTHKPISEVRPGDKVIGFVQGTPKARAKTVHTTVKNVFSKPGEIYELQMASGRKVRCTLDHMWYSKRTKGSEAHGTYNGRKAYYKPKIGRKLMWVTNCDFDVSKDEAALWSYLAGIVDGEGSVKRGVIDITQSTGKNIVVCNKIQETLDKLGLRYVVEERDRSKDNPKWQPVKRFVIHGVRDVFPMLINVANAAKKNEMQWIMDKNCHMFVRDEDKIVGMTFLRNDTVYALETETGNYIAWGYASSNSQYMQDPILSVNQDFQQSMFKYFDDQQLAGLTLQYTTTVDLAGYKKNSDENVILTVAKEVHGERWFVVDIVHGRMTPGEVIDAIFMTQARYKSDIYIEGTAYQSTMKWHVEERQKKTRQYFPVHEIKPKGAKEDRIRSLLALFNLGILYFRPQYTALERQLLQFPRGKNDDLADCLASQLLVVDHGGSNVTQYKKKQTSYLRRR